MGLNFTLVLLLAWIILLSAVAAYLIADLFFGRRLFTFGPMMGRSKSTIFADAADATEVGSAGLVGGYLIAEENMSGFPLQIDLYTDRDIFIGRSKRECDVALRDITISRRHARISCDNGEFYLEDLGSKGGTFVGQRRLRPDHRHHLQSGEIVHFYTFGYRFEYANERTYVPDPMGTQS